MLCQCPGEVNREMLMRLADEQEPGGGYTTESLREHLATCQACQVCMSSIERRRGQLKKQFDGFRNRMERILVEARQRKEVEDEEYVRHYEAAEQLRRDLAEQTDDRQLATLQDLELANSRNTIEMLTDEGDTRVTAVRELVTALQRVHKMTDPKRRTAWFEMLAMWARHIVLKISEVELQDLTRASVRAATSANPMIPLDRPEAVAIALTVATDTATRLSPEPILDLKSDNPGVLVYHRGLHKAAAANASVR
jgi:hypothetical protein